MDLAALDRISPFVRMVRVQHDVSIAGKWQDIDHVFTLVTSGEADFIAEGVRRQVKRGDVILMPPFCTHVIVSSGDQPLAQSIVHFDFFEDPQRCGLRHEDVLERDFPKVAPERERIMDGQVFIASLKESDVVRLERLFGRMHNEFRSLCAGEGCHALLRAYCTELLVEALRCGRRENADGGASAPGRSKSWLHIENALEYMNAHYAEEDLSNERISAAIGVSPNYLTKRFRVCFGMPLHRYLVRLRVEKARQLLEMGGCNVTEAAAATGFSSIHVFSKTFKSVLGMTPSAYLDEIADEKAVMRFHGEKSLIDRRRRAMLPDRPEEEIGEVDSNEQQKDRV